MITRFGINKILAGLARFVSSILTPLLMPTYGAIIVLWASVLCTNPTGHRVAVIMVMLGITCVLPMIGIGVLHHFGVISDKRLGKSSERHIPYAIALACYTAATFYLNHVHSPMWFTMFAAGGTVALFITALVNIKWKISAHLTGIGGVVALVYQLHSMNLGVFTMKWLLCAVILLAGVLGTARLILKCHTVMQAILGFVSGFTCVTLAMKLFG